MPAGDLPLLPVQPVGTDIHMLIHGPSCGCWCLHEPREDADWSKATHTASKALLPNLYWVSGFAFVNCEPLLVQSCMQNSKLIAITSH